MYCIDIQDEEHMLRFGAALAVQLQPPCIVYLHGPLGAGKTTLVRGILTAMGHRGVVKSPTYTLVEPYQCAATTVYHFDLYRLHDPEELDAMGFRDYLSSDAVCLIEWPERGDGYLPEPSITVQIELLADKPQQRRIRWVASQD